MAKGKKNAADAWRPQTRLVRGGIVRSAHGETSEALYLTSSFVYASAEEAEARFKGEAPGFIYSRYGNPTVAMFEKRMALLEGAEACFATATGMAAVFASLMCQLHAGQRVVASRALFGSCHFIITQLLPRWGIATQLVDGTNSRSGRRPFVRVLRRSSSRRRPTPRSSSSISRRSPSSRTPRVPSSSSITCSPHRCCSGPWRWAPTSSSIPQPSTSMGRAGHSAAPSSRARSSTASGSCPTCATLGPR